MSRRGRPGAGRAVLLSATALPWAWFAVRDAHPLTEWVAILLPLLGAGAAVTAGLVAVAVRRHALWAVTASLLALTAVATVAPWAPRPTAAPATGLRLATANVLGDNDQPEAVAEDLLALDADVLVVSEMSPLLDELAERLDEVYPHRYRAKGDDVAVWSAYPVAGTDLPTGSALTAARGGRAVVDAPSGAFALYATHLYRPSRDAFGNEVTVEQQRRLVRELDRLVRADPLPAVLAGDLNVADRSSAYRTLARDRVDAARAGWTGPTSLKTRNRPLLLRIDHLLLPRDWCATGARRTALSGSDHLAVSADVGPCSVASG